MKKKTDYQVGIETMYKRLKAERAAHQETLNLLGKRQSELDVERVKISTLVEDGIALSQENARLRDKIKALQSEREVLMKQRASHPIRSVDPTAEVVMNMKRAMQSQIGATAHVLDAMGELVDHVSGRKARRERERELSIVDDPTGERG